MKKIIIIAIFFATETVRADTTITESQNNTGEISVVAAGNNFAIEDGITISNFTNTKGNKGGYLSLDAAAGTITIGDDVSFIDNSAYSGGGAIKALHGFSMGDNALFEGNRVLDGWSAGGAVYVRTLAGQTVSIGDGAIFRNNSVESATANMGGAIGIDADNKGVLNIGANARFENNSAGAGSGGAISNWGVAGNITIGDGATFSGNSAANGGAIMNVGTLTLGSASFTGAGDSIFLAGGTTTITGDITSKSSLTMMAGTLDIGNSKLAFDGEVSILNNSKLMILINSDSDYGSISAGRLVAGASNQSTPVFPNLQLVVAPGANISGKLNIFNSNNSSMNFGGVSITERDSGTPLPTGNPLYNFYSAGDGDIYVARVSTARDLAASLSGVPYVAAAAGGWENLSNPGGNVTAIQNSINMLAQTDTNEFMRAMRTLSHNNSALLLFAGFHHIGAAFADAGKPLAGISEHCGNEYGGCKPVAPGPVEIWGRYSGGSADFKSRMNGGFDADFDGFAAGANMLVAPESIIGFSVNHTGTDVRVSDISTDADANSISAFFKTRSGSFFFNAAAGAGWVDWDENKNVAGLGVDSDIRSQFFAGEVDGGMKLGAFSPRVGVRYSRIKIKKYTDTAMQTFGAWNADAITAIAGVDFGEKISAGNFTLIPTFGLSYSYDLRDGGDDDFGVSINQTNVYRIPVELPNRNGVSASAGLWIAASNSLKFGIDYQKEWRGDYDAESFRVSATTGF